jgi:hypothetical protein
VFTFTTVATLSPEPQLRSANVKAAKMDALEESRLRCPKHFHLYKRGASSSRHAHADPAATATAVDEDADSLQLTAEPGELARLTGQPSSPPNDEDIVDPESK